jgi:hypothetical protein
MINSQEDVVLAATEEGLRRYPPNALVDDPMGETGYAETDPYGYDEVARNAFIAGALFGLNWQGESK